jgi:DNA polymerase-3 subunit delta
MTSKKQKPIKPVYLIYSAELALIEEALARLRKRLFKNEEDDTNCQIFEAKETSATDIISACQAIAFGAEWRLVIVKQYEQLNQSEKKRLISYIKQPCDNTVLVLVQQDRDLNGRAKVNKADPLFKLARQQDLAWEITDSKPTKTWVKEEFLKRNQVITDDGLDFFLETVGNQRVRLKTEIEKVNLYHQDTKRISADQLSEIVSPSNEGSALLLFKLILQGKMYRALLLLDWLTSSSKEASIIITLLERQLSLIARAKAYSVNCSNQELAAKLSVSPGRAYYLIQDARKLPWRALKQSIKLVKKADFSRKTNLGDIRTILEQLVIELSKTIATS